jgi:hypothetical protein
MFVRHPVDNQSFHVSIRTSSHCACLKTRRLHILDPAHCGLVGVTVRILVEESGVDMNIVGLERRLEGDVATRKVGQASGKIVHSELKVLTSCER